MRQLLFAALAAMALSAPSLAADNAQQERMKDCNAQESGISGDARKQFMSSCLSGATAEAKKPHCSKGKLCGNSCIPKNEVCHQLAREDAPRGR